LEALGARAVDYGAAGGLPPERSLLRDGRGPPEVSDVGEPLEVAPVEHQPRALNLMIIADDSRHRLRAGTRRHRLGARVIGYPGTALLGYPSESDLAILRVTRRRSEC